tara:strand:- start:864 stop:1109 length:246 start_codon:yes stop_codon:yes gene_type:complete
MRLTLTILAALGIAACGSVHPETVRQIAYEGTYAGVHELTCLSEEGVAAIEDSLVQLYVDAAADGVLNAIGDALAVDTPCD